METDIQKKRHHYTPITYLNHFADNLGRIYAYRKDDVDTPLHVRPSEIAFERYYYSQPLPEGGRDNNTLEDFFSTIETTWPSLVGRIRSGSTDPLDVEELFTFMTLMRVRVPATRDLIEMSRAEEVKATLGVLNRSGMLPPMPPGYDNLLNDVIISIDPHQSLHAIPDLSRGFGTVLDSLGFEVLHNKTKIGFLTSDNPVIYFDPTVPEGKILPYQIRPPHGSIELLFPIDPTTVLCGRTGRPGTFRHSTMASSQAVKRINLFLSRFGYRFVFSPGRTHQSVISKYANTSPVGKFVTVPTPTGGIFLSSSWVFGPRPAKPQWSGSE